MLQTKPVFPQMVLFVSKYRVTYAENMLIGEE